MWSQNKRQKIWESLLDGLINFTTQIAWINSFFKKKIVTKALFIYKNNIFQENTNQRKH